MFLLVPDFRNFPPNSTPIPINCHGKIKIDEKSIPPHLRGKQLKGSFGFITYPDGSKKCYFVHMDD